MQLTYTHLATALLFDVITHWFITNFPFQQIVKHLNTKNPNRLKLYVCGSQIYPKYIKIYQTVNIIKTQKQTQNRERRLKKKCLKKHPQFMNIKYPTQHTHTKNTQTHDIECVVKLNNATHL